MKTQPMERPASRRITRPLATSLLDSFYALLGGTSPVSAPDKVEDIRASMLAELEHHDATTHARVIRHIRYAVDVQALWYMRGELMGALSTQYGESEARTRLDRISRLFNGQLPRSLKSRPSPLEI